MKMYLKKSCGDLVPRPNSKKMEAVDYHHGYASASMYPNAISFYYLQRADYSWNDDYLSDKDAIALTNDEKIDWSKYKDDIEVMRKTYDKKWKDFIALHKSIFDKYKINGCAIMKGKHFYEGRSNGYVVISSIQEEKCFIADMRNIGIDVTNMV